MMPSFSPSCQVYKANLVSLRTRVDDNLEIAKPECCNLLACDLGRFVRSRRPAEDVLQQDRVTRIIKIPAAPVLKGSHKVLGSIWRRQRLLIPTLGNQAVLGLRVHPVPNLAETHHHLPGVNSSHVSLSGPQNC